MLVNNDDGPYTHRESSRQNLGLQFIVARPALHTRDHIHVVNQVHERLRGTNSRRRPGQVMEEDFGSSAESSSP